MDLDVQTGALLLLIAAVVAMLTRRLRLPYSVGLVIGRRDRPGLCHCLFSLRPRACSTMVRQSLSERYLLLDRNARRQALLWGRVAIAWWR